LAGDNIVRLAADSFAAQQSRSADGCTARPGFLPISQAASLLFADVFHYPDLDKRVNTYLDIFIQVCTMQGIGVALDKESRLLCSPL